MTDPSKPDQTGDISKWADVVKVTGSPLKLFALIVLVCNTVFGIAAAFQSERVFIYALHTFLAVVSAFVLIAIWSPRSFYSPTELAGLVELEARMDSDKSIFPEGRPLLATVMFLLGLGLYGAYQYLTR